MQLLLWFGIILCLAQSAMFSGLTIGFFGLSRLRLEIETATRDKNAFKVLQLRRDSNYLLATLLWGNVSVNVLLTLLTDSVLTGFVAFFASTFGITIFGEILPQAYLSRHALRVGVMFIPVIKVYQLLLYPVVKPTAIILDRWLGKEGVHYFAEEEIITLIKKHIKALDSDVDLIEGLGAINFLTLDDEKIFEEGEPIDPKSIIPVSIEKGLPVLGDVSDENNPLMKKIKQTDKKWVILTDESDEPKFVMDVDHFFRKYATSEKIPPVRKYCHKPIVIKDPEATIGEAIRKFTVDAEHPEDDVVDRDVILFWSDQKRIITGADILGKLLRGIVKTKTVFK